MKNIFTLLLALTINPNLSSCQLKEFIQKNTVAIRSADFGDTAYEDLLPIAHAIGEKQVVMLGELYHGDGEGIRMKSRLVRFLHERMGFNVIVFESDFFSLNHGPESNIPLDSVIYLSVFPVWTKCLQNKELFQYILRNAKSENELKISGFDNRGISGYGMRYLKKAVDTFLRGQKIPFTQRPDYNYFITSIGRSYSILEGRNKAALDSLLQLMPIVIKQVSAQTTDGFYLQVLKGLLSNYNLALHYRYSNAYKTDRKDYPLHDLQLADNLKWLVSNKYANEKIIVWAHNAHVEKGPLDNIVHRGYNSMGYYFTQDPQLAAQTYILGLTCYEGAGGLTINNVTEKVTRPNKNGIESWIHKKGYPYAFTDLKHLPNEREPFFMKTYINTESQLPWKAFYDGILYIQEAKPCGKLDGFSN